VLVVSDDPLARAGLRRLLEEQTDLEVAGESQADGSVMPAYQAYQPDVVLWDLGWVDHGSGWREPLSELVESGGRVVALIAEHAQVEELRVAGARGLLSREAGRERIAAAVAAVQHGLLALDPRFEGPIPSAPEDTPLEGPTEREREVLQLMAEGLSNRSIAFRLGISEHTVKFHVNGILRKLGAQSRTDAVVRATRLGWILL
jgi:DNA-binding NarL/FixJ family response regulator